MGGATRYLIALRTAMLVVGVGGVMLELPYQFAPSLPARGNPPLFIIGDSVTAGAGVAEKRVWPALLPKSVEVHNFARMAATVSSARQNQCDELPAEGGLLLLEIGGNDLLGNTAPGQFEADLDQLLAHVAAPGRTLMMFELPLPPLSNEYGRVQRKLAAKHGVRLIPKRIFMSVLAGDDTTLDSIHLSNSGHERMAAAVWQVIAPAYSSPAATES